MRASCGVLVARILTPDGELLRVPSVVLHRKIDVRSYVPETTRCCRAFRLFRGRLHRFGMQAAQRTDDRVRDVDTRGVKSAVSVATA